MTDLFKTSRFLYGTGVACIGVQQFLYADFRPVLIPEWPLWIHSFAGWAYIAGALLVVGGIFVVTGIQKNKASLFLGIFFLFLFIAFHLSDLFFINPYTHHLGTWTNALKELALSGGGLIMAGMFLKEDTNSQNDNNGSIAATLISTGRVFFSIMLIAFGIDHFYYTDFVATLVPTWMPGALFWTYFGAITLIGSGLAFMIKFKLDLIGKLCGIMLFAWFLILHLPRSFADPFGNKGNEVTSVFQAFAFSGIAFAIAASSQNRRKAG